MPHSPAHNCRIGCPPARHFPAVRSFADNRSRRAAEARASWETAKAGSPGRRTGRSARSAPRRARRSPRRVIGDPERLRDRRGAQRRVSRCRRDVIQPGQRATAADQQGCARSRSPAGRWRAGWRVSEQTGARVRPGPGSGAVSRHRQVCAVRGHAHPRPGDCPWDNRLPGMAVRPAAGACGPAGYRRASRRWGAWPRATPR